MRRSVVMRALVEPIVSGVVARRLILRMLASAMLQRVTGSSPRTGARTDLGGPQPEAARTDLAVGLGSAHLVDASEGVP